MAKLIVIVEIFVAKSDAEHPLANQSADSMLNEIWPTLVLETGSKTIDQPDRTIVSADRYRH